MKELVRSHPWRQVRWHINDLFNRQIFYEIYYEISALSREEIREHVLSRIIDKIDEQLEY